METSTASYPPSPPSWLYCCFTTTAKTARTDNADDQLATAHHTDKHALYRNMYLPLDRAAQAINGRIDGIIPYFDPINRIKEEFKPEMRESHAQLLSFRLRLQDALIKRFLDLTENDKSFVKRLLSLRAVVQSKLGNHFNPYDDNGHELAFWSGREVQTCLEKNEVKDNKKLYFWDRTLKKMVGFYHTHREDEFSQALLLMVMTFVLPDTRHPIKYLCSHPGAVFIKKSFFFNVEIPILLQLLKLLNPSLRKLQVKSFHPSSDGSVIRCAELTFSRRDKTVSYNLNKCTTDAFEEKWNRGHVIPTSYNSVSASTSAKAPPECNLSSIILPSATSETTVKLCYADKVLSQKIAVSPIVHCLSTTFINRCNPQFFTDNDSKKQAILDKLDPTRQQLFQELTSNCFITQYIVSDMQRFKEIFCCPSHTTEHTTQPTLTPRGAGHDYDEVSYLKTLLLYKAILSKTPSETKACIIASFYENVLNSIIDLNNIGQPIITCLYCLLMKFFSDNQESIDKKQLTNIQLLINQLDTYKNISSDIPELTRYFEPDFLTQLARNPNMMLKDFDPDTLILISIAIFTIRLPLKSVSLNLLSA